MLALRSCRLFETFDVENARDQISRVMQPHVLQICSQAVATRSHMDFLRLRGLGFGTIAFGHAEISVPPLDDYHLIVFCLRGRARIRTVAGEVEIDRSRGVACAPDRPVSGRFSADCEQFVVRIERQRLADFSGDPGIRLAPVVDLTNARLLPWLRAMRSLAADHAMLAAVRDDPQVAADYEQLLLRLLLKGQAVAGDGVAQPSVRPASVRRAIAYLEAHAALPVTLAEVAAAAGVPERTLHDSFRHFEKISPMRYLRDLRLDRVRRRLVADCGDSVTAIALSEGFTHLGRFAQDFFARFGERPSEVFQKRR